jgi:hypothetical protein
MSDNHPYIDSITREINRYTSMINKLRTENAYFNNKKETITNKNATYINDINDTNAASVYNYNILIIIYIILAIIVSIYIFKLPIPRWLIILSIFMIITFPFYIYTIQYFLYVIAEYMYSLILSIEYSPK